MSAKRWQRLEALFDEGLQVDAARREQWLAGLPDDAELITELRSMLAADDVTDRLKACIGNALAPADEQPLSGARLGAWRLVSELGSGGMGVVFLAEREDGGFRQQAAIKVMQLLGGGNAAQQLRHERQILAELEHPCIARLLDGGETERGQPYLVMEYVRGECITDAVRRKPLSIDQRLSLLAEVARAIHYAHQRLIIHRDIKPANVLLREDGRPVLLDFGIAKLLDPDARHDATQPWFTPGYAAPEQRDGGTVSTATDVYALGLLMSQLLCDKPPRLLADGRLALPSQRVEPSRRASLRGDLDRIVARATALEPERRYASAETFAEDIDRYRRGLPIQATPDTAGYRIGKWLRRHPYATAATLAALLALGTMGWRLASERNLALAAEARAREESQAALATTEFLTELFQQAEPGTARTELTPTALIDRGREQLLARTDVAPAYRSRLLGTLGRIYGYLGEPERATNTLEQALTDARSAHMDPLFEAELLSRLGSVYDDRLDWTEAEAAFSKALAIQQEHGQPIDIARALSDVGLLQTRLGRLSEAEETLKQAQQQLTALAGKDSNEAALARVYLAETLTQEGRAAEAQPLMAGGIATLRANLSATDPTLLSALGFQATQLREAGDAEAAEQVMLEIIAKRREILEPDSGLLAMSISELGSTYYEQGRTREATEQFEEALRISQQRLGPEDPSLAIDYNNVAALYEEMGDYASAEPFMRHALAVIETRPDEQALHIAQFRQSLGRLLMLSGQRDESLQLLQQEIGDGEEGLWSVQRGRRRLHLAEWHRRWGSAAESQHWLDDAQKHVDDLGGMQSSRYAQLLRTKALLSQSQGDLQRASALLIQARDLLAETRGETYVGIGEIDLDLAEIDLATANVSSATTHLKDARRIIEPVMAATAPQRTKLAHLQSLILKRAKSNERDHGNS